MNEKRDSERARAKEAELEEIQARTERHGAAQMASLDRMAKDVIELLKDDPDAITSVQRLEELRAKTAPPETPPPASEHAPRLAPRGPEPPYRILVVDDDADIRDALSASLTEEGFFVATATDARVAINVLHGMGRCDCVLLDWFMPEYTGAAYRDFIAHTRHAAIPTLIITAASMEQMKPEIRGEHVFTKPIVLDHLLSAVREKIAKRNRL